MPIVGNADGHDSRTTNDIQGSKPNNFEPKHQTQGNIGNKTPDLQTNHVTQNSRSKAPRAPFREHDLYMPTANVVRIMRQAVPPHAKVTDEAKEMLQECVTEFISFITGEANENCQLEHRKTITADDVIGAMSRLGFDHYVEPLTIYLQKYRESEMLPPIHRRGLGNMGPEATTVISITNSQPPFDVVHPQFARFNTAAGNVGMYNNGSGTSTGPITVDQSLHTATVFDNGPSWAHGVGDGPSDGEGVGPSRPPQAGLDFYNSYGLFK